MLWYCSDMVACIKYPLYIHTISSVDGFGSVRPALGWGKAEDYEGRKNCLDEKYLQTLVLLELGKCDAMHLFFKDMIGLLLKLLTYVVLLVLTLCFEMPSVLAYPSYRFCSSSTRLGKKPCLLLCMGELASRQDFILCLLTNLHVPQCLALSSSGYLDLNVASRNPMSWWCHCQQKRGVPVLRILGLTFPFH